jgi:hypothetical protein
LDKKRAALVALALAAGCRQPRTFPASLAPEEFAGAAACVECHAAEHRQWAASAHGRALASVGEAATRAAFDGRAVQLHDGQVTPLHEDDGWFMDIDAAGTHERRRVDLVLASGRQHQVFLSRADDGTLVPLPLYWSTVGNHWKPLGLYFGGALDPASPSYFGAFETMGLRCFNCHASRARYRVDGRRAEITFGGMSIDCEACHGPLASHVRARRAGIADAPENLRLLGQEREAALCGSCHAAKEEHDFPGELFVETLAAAGFRPDATQFSTVYQLAGHLMSECYRKGALTCSSCHAPHSQQPRDLAGASADGANSDRQCTVCHRDKREPAAAIAHTHHAPSVRCIDCHMRRTFIRGTPEREQETSDHSISIPRPSETVELGLDNACQRCHAQNPPSWAIEALSRWGARRSLEVRPWVRAITEARQKRPGAATALLGLLDQPDFVRWSALALLAHLPPDPSVPPRLEELTRAPEAQTRALAFAALIAQDPLHASHWRARAAADPHAFVRLYAFPGGDAATYTEAELRQYEQDLLSRAHEPPLHRLRWLAELRRQRGEPAEARHLESLAVGLGPPPR